MHRWLARHAISLGLVAIAAFAIVVVVLAVAHSALPAVPWVAGGGEVLMTREQYNEMILEHRGAQGATALAVLLAVSAATVALARRRR